jgi:hypothetical protein
VTGCGHAGVVNIVRRAQQLTGIERVHAIVGGFHLNGPLFEPMIPATVAALQQIRPRYLVPGHCTGFSAARALAEAMPDAFLVNSVGTTFVFLAIRRHRALVHTSAGYTLACQCSGIGLACGQPGRVSGSRRERR